MKDGDTSLCQRSGKSRRFDESKDANINDGMLIKSDKHKF